MLIDTASRCTIADDDKVLAHNFRLRLGSGGGVVGMVGVGGSNEYMYIIYDGNTVLCTIILVKNLL